MLNGACMRVPGETVPRGLSPYPILLIIKGERCKRGAAEGREEGVGGAKATGANIKLNVDKPEGGQSCIGSPLAVLSKTIQKNKLMY